VRAVDENLTRIVIRNKNLEKVISVKVLKRAIIRGKIGKKYKKGFKPNTWARGVIENLKPLAGACAGILQMKKLRAYCLKLILHVF